MRPPQALKKSPRPTPAEVTFSWADHVRPHPDNQQQRLNALLYLEQLGRTTVTQPIPDSGISLPVIALVKK